MQTQVDRYFVVVSPGLETIAADELMALGIKPQLKLRGGVEFSGGLKELYLANLWLRTASRVLVRLGDVSARDFPTLYQRLSRLPWGRFIKPGCGCAIKATSRASRLVHGGRIAETCRSAISKALGLDLPLVADGQKIFLRFENNRCQVSIDSSGEHLHRRGYRRATTGAPLRETLAAACLLSLGYDGSEPLCDPMTGSGTFAAEAALIALKVAPGKSRSFAFMHWPKYRPGLWQQFLLEAQKEERAELPSPILASDNNPKAVDAALINFLALGFDRMIQLVQTDMREIDALPSGQGLVLCNPPYGERLGKNASLASLYRDLGALYRGLFCDWRRALLCPQSTLLKQCGLDFDTSLKFSNGGIKVELITVRPPS